MFVCCAKEKDGAPAAKKRKSDKKTHSNDPGLRTYEQWLALPAETLKLHCESAGLACDGDRYDLALRIFRYYNEGDAIAGISVPPATSIIGEDPIPAIESTDSTLDWLFPVSSGTLDLPMVGFPTIAAPDGGVHFSIASSGAIPRITIRRQGDVATFDSTHDLVSECLVSTIGTVPSLGTSDFP